MKLRLTLALLSGLVAGSVHAACTTPPGNRGDQVYAIDQNMMVYCDGTNWVSMAGGVSVTLGGGADPRIGTLGSSGQWCTTNGSQINCASAAPPVNGGTGANTYLAYWSSGNQLEGNSGLTYNSASGLLAATNISATNLTASGMISTSALYVNGVAVTGGASGDSIVSTSANVVAGNGGTVSISTGGVSGTAYFDTTGRLVVPGISVTTAQASFTTLTAGIVSSTAVQMTSDTTVCGASTAGRVTYASGSLMLCNGTSWSNVGIGVPAGTIAAFASASCPAGWTEYTAARGAFLRGIDNGAGLDPDGTRAAGAYQADAFQGHTHSGDYASYNGQGTASGSNLGASAWYLKPAAPSGFSTYGSYGSPRVSSETRPKNVAVTFCQYSGVGGTYSTVSSSLVAGSDTQVQYNSNGGFAGSPNFTYNAGLLTLTGTVTATNVYANAISASTASLGSVGAGNINASGVVSATGVTANGVPVMAGMFYKADPDSVAFTKTGAGTVSIKAGTVVQVGTYTVNYAGATAVSMPSLTAGTDYAIYACGNGTAVADSNWTSTTSCTGGYRKIGGFHYAPGGNATAQSGGDSTPAINAYSLWDLHWRPKCDPRGMTLVANSFWVDIYLLNTDPDTNGTSAYNKTIADSGNPPKVPAMFGGNGSTAYSTLDWYAAAEIMKSQGKELLSQSEFMTAAYGTTENSSSGADPVTTGLSATYTSKWGLMQSTGQMWVWSRDQSYRYDSSTWAWNNVNGGRGQVYIQGGHGIVYGLFGGTWYDAGLSGSRASAWYDYPWSSSVNFGARGRCDHLRLE
ncbi:phage major tropism determinant [Rhodopseudomonas parapalustris]